MMHNNRRSTLIGLCVAWLLSACQQSDVTALVDEKLAEIHAQPAAPIVQPLDDEPVAPVVYHAGRDPFAHPYRQTVVAENKDVANTAQAKTTNRSAQSDESTIKPSPQVIHPSATVSAPNAQHAAPKMVGKVIAVDTQRPPQALEVYELHTLRYQGRIMNQQRQVALIQAPNGQLHQVQLGQYLGRNRGKIIAIDAQALSIQEAIEGADGRYYERNTHLALR